MGEFTPAELERLRALRWTGTWSDEQLKRMEISLKDVRLLTRRVEELDLEEYHTADDLMRFTLRRLEEELRASQEYLKDQIETTRIAELQVKEATHALAAVKALIDGAMYVSGDEVNIRWDEIETEFRMGGFIPQDEPEAVAEAASAVEDPPPAAETPPPEAPPEEPRETRWEAKAREREPMSQEEQERAMYEALKSAAGDEPQVQASIAVLSAKSGVANGSTLTVLRRLAAAGRIEIISDKPEKGTPRPNIYRFTEVPTETAPEAAPEPEPAPADPEPPVNAEVAAEKLAGAWGATVNRKPPKPTGAVSQSAPLRDRIIGILGNAACTSSGLASMLDVKELAICQTLDAMRHEGTVAADDMPEAGRRSQLWRLPPVQEAGAA